MRASQRVLFIKLDFNSCNYHFTSTQTAAHGLASTPAVVPRN